MKLPKGCAAHSDCFTCPYDDCIALNSSGPTRNAPVNSTELRRHRRRLIQQRRMDERQAKQELAYRLLMRQVPQHLIAKAIGVKTESTAVKYAQRAAGDAEQRAASTKASSDSTERPLPAGYRRRRPLPALMP